MRHAFSTLASVVLTLAAFNVLAQPGPDLPCPGCDDPVYAPYPETGSWYNPQQSGTGLTVEVQNGKLLAYYFGYDTEGEPEWLMLSGNLEPGTAPGVLWEIDVAPLWVTGGNCMTCAYSPPSDFAAQEPIHIEFLQRAHARITFPDESQQYFIPLLFGDNGQAFFPEVTEHRFPTITEDPYSNLWLMTIKEFSNEEHSPWDWLGGIVSIREGQYRTGGSDIGKLVYTMTLPAPPPEGAVPFGDIACAPDMVEGGMGCQIRTTGAEPRYFNIPIGHFTDSRIFGESEDGARIEGFRLQYD